MLTIIDQTKRMDEIRHLFNEIAGVQMAIGLLEGEARAKAAREWREFSDTLTSKLRAAKYFQYDSGLFIKFVSAQHVEVVLAPCFVSIEAFDGLWMDTIGESFVTTKEAYQQAVESVLEAGGMFA